MRVSEKGFVLWFTGLPSSGKTTLAKVMADKLRDVGMKVELLDGDQVRKSLSPDLGFSKREREIHAQRVAYLCKLLSRNGIVSIVSLISPRQQARNHIGTTFIEIWTKCSLEACMERDVKGAQKGARGQDKRHDRSAGPVRAAGRERGNGRHGT